MKIHIFRTDSGDFNAIVTGESNYPRESLEAIKAFLDDPAKRLMVFENDSDDVAVEVVWL
jgi:hypothetical protein